MKVPVKVVQGQIQRCYTGLTIMMFNGSVCPSKRNATLLLRYINMTYSTCGPSPSLYVKSNDGIDWTLLMTFWVSHPSSLTLCRCLIERFHPVLLKQGAKRKTLLDSEGALDWRKCKGNIWRHKFAVWTIGFIRKPNYLGHMTNL